MTNSNDGKNRRVLIIDDNQAIHDDFRKILAPDVLAGDAELAASEAVLFGTPSRTPVRLQFELDSAYQGQEGVTLVEKALKEDRPYAMAFVDVRMPPGIDGVETTRKIYELDPRIQVVICTAYSDYSWEEMFAEIGERDRLVILKKPFDTVEALQLAYAFTEKWWLHRRAQQRVEELEQRVVERTRKLKESNRALRRRERQLSIQCAVSRVLAESVSDEQTGPNILQTLCDGFGWDMGRLWSLNQHSDVLRCSATWLAPGLSTEGIKQACGNTEFTRGVGLPGRVWTEGKPVWIDDVRKEVKSPFSGEFERIGMRKGVGFPIVNSGEVCGVIEMFSARESEPDQELSSLFDVLGEQIGQYIHRRRLEEKLFRSEKLKTVGKLAGGVAHEFNSIVTAISGQSELLLTDLPSDSPLCASVIEIRKAADRAAVLTRQLLAYGRRQFMRKTTIDLNEELRDMEGMLRRVLGAELDVRLVLADDLPMIEADAGKIEEVIVSLAMNAVDAMPDGGKLTLETSTVTLEPDSIGRDAELTPGDYVMLAVSDTGIGMCAETRARVFEPFFTTKDVGKGTGLGLATCYGVVKQSAGHISVYSEPGRGTTFKVFLPQSSGEAPVTGMTRTPEEMPRGTERILLVEDDPALREMAAMVLVRLGYAVQSASDGVSALKIAEEDDDGSLDLLLTDMVMPDLDGCELSERITATNPDTKVLFTSAYPGKAIEHQEALRPGANLLQKPFTAAALADKVRDVLDS